MDALKLFSFKIDHMFLFTVLDCDQYNQQEAGFLQTPEGQGFICSFIVHADFGSDPKLQD